MQKEHKEIWRSWCLDFVQLFNQGYSLKQIMKKYNTLFSWTTIAKEIVRTAEENKIRLMPPLLKVGVWEPEAFEQEFTTLWEFPRRGNWCVHSGDYRGNWAPQVPRNIILQYSSEDEIVLDCFQGGGTTIIECSLLGRKGIGLDISPHAINMCKQRLLEMRDVAAQKAITLRPEYSPRIMYGDARELPFSDSSVDLVCCQPPYADAIGYTWDVNGDLSKIHDIDEFCAKMKIVASEIYRVLKADKRCAIMIGDIRRNKMIIPLGFMVLQQFVDAGFGTEEIIIKKQFQDRSSEFYIKKGEKIKNLRYRIEHEYIFVLRKPNQTNEESTKWKKKPQK
jgi:DNA modification methylase